MKTISLIILLMLTSVANAATVIYVPGDRRADVIGQGIGAGLNSYFMERARTQRIDRGLALQRAWAEAKLLREWREENWRAIEQLEIELIR